MSLTIEEAKAFIVDAEKSRANWLLNAKTSWDEIKKIQKNGRLWSVTPNAIRKRAKYPAWYSIFKIRQPLVLSRIGIPIGKDTTQDGQDNIGATAAVCLERLAINLPKSFDYFDVLSACRDDLLATNMGLARAYYERDAIKQKVKEYIQPQQNETGEMVFVGADGKEVTSDNIGQDDEGYFIEHEEVVDVENERICLEPVLYRDIYIDPGIRRFRRCRRMAFAEHYSKEEFVEIFGRDAYDQIGKPEDNAQDEAAPKRQDIKVFEYWDWYEKECKWWAENGQDFIKPKGYFEPDPDEYEDGGKPNGLYGLEKFFPVPDPLMMNQPTDDFWPIPEYYQLKEVFEDIHNLFSRMIAVTKAFRARLLFDNNVEGLQQALNEAAEGDAFGVSNLTASLSQAGGTLDGVVQYIPVEKLVASLQSLYEALEQRLNMIYRLTGTSDLLQGLAADQTQRTFGERQMLEKYSLNQLAEPQRKMQEFVRDCYQLMCEMALKNFKDASLDLYMMPQTLTPEHKQRYRAAVGMLKSNTKRFRIELETDSTIALNEEYDKQMRIELVNTLTSAIEKTASVAQSAPELLIPELHCLKYLIQGLRQGKLFQAEINEAIDGVIKDAENAPEPFNKDEVSLQLEAKRIDSQNKLQEYKILSDERIEVAKVNQAQRVTAIETQLEQFKAAVEQQKSSEETRFAYDKLNADIFKVQEELELKKEEILVELRKIADKKEVDEFSLMIDERTKAFEIQLDQAQQSLQEQKVMLDEQEKYATEERLQAEHKLNEFESQLRMMAMVKEMSTPPQKEQPDIINHIHLPMPPKTKKKVDIERDEFGNMKSFQSSDVSEPVE